MRLRLLTVVVAVAVLVGPAYAWPAGCDGASSRREAASVAPVGSGLVTFIGASASDGYGLGGEVTLSRTFHANLAAPGYECRNFATGEFLKLNLDEREVIVREALAKKPDLVVAVDFLFWYAYGMTPNDEVRMRRFESGLEMLGRFNCPMVVGDIPDVQAAEKVVPMIRLVLPSPDFLRRANRRLWEWVNARDRLLPTLVLPLANAMTAQMAGAPLRIGDREHPTIGLLQKDQLHPTLEGHRVLCELLQQTLIDGNLFRRDDFK